jgi:predicted esterase
LTAGGNAKESLLRERWILCLLAALSMIPTRAGAGGDDPFRVADLPPERVYAASPETRANAAVAGIPMLGVLAGVAGEIEPAALIRLRRAIGGPLPGGVPPGSKITGILLLVRDDRAERVEFFMTPDGASGVRCPDRPDQPTWSIDPDPLDAIGAPWWRVGWAPDRAEPGERLSVDGSDAAASPVTLDGATVRRVFRAHYPALSRRIADERFHLRIPAGHDASRPAGVLVWVSPTDDGRPPPVLEVAADGLGLIAVGADQAGNQRELTDRLQLVLDAVETVRRRHLIDDQRIYLVGMSGGGRVAAILQCAMPDLFAGSVPIVGLGSYHAAPTGSGGRNDTRWPATFGKPVPPVFRLARERRIGAITGEMDFNQPEMSARARLMTEDGLQVRLEIVPGMGHAMPDAGRLADMVRWVDEPRRGAIEAGTAEARRLLDAIPEDADANDSEVLAALIGVIRAGPWSEPAWEAAERLGFSRRGFVNPDASDPSAPSAP